MTRLSLTILLVVALLAPVARAARPPMLLPGDALAARVVADPDTWIVGARTVAASRRLADRFGAEPVGSLGAHVIVRGKTRGFAAALRRRGLLIYAEPNILARPRATGGDPYTSAAGWRPAVVEPGLEPPAITGSSPKLALIDSKLETNHPEFAGGRITTVGGGAVEDSHGTATAAMAAAPTNGVGIEGIWPGMVATNFATDLSCGDIVDHIEAVVKGGYSVLNMSYGSEAECFSESAALQRAYGIGVLLVAAAGNEFAEGNPLEYPASLPHVLTVAANDAQGNSSYFSNANAAMDLSAPGEGVLTAVPPAHDGDGDGDGYEFVSGTSFSAPIVAGAAAWVRAVRPDLSVGQAGEVVRRSATDLDSEGWDQNTGYGMLNVGAALRMEEPFYDPSEPNEDIFWVNGKVFGKPDALVFDGKPRKRSFGATLDKFEDPADVYRARIPGRSSVKITVKPIFGDPDLAVFRGKAKNTNARAISRSNRNGKATDSVVLENSGRGSGLVYVEVYIDTRAEGLEAGYLIKFARVR